MEYKNINDNTGWPPSNYPIFLALVLLATTAVTLAMGDETQAEELAIYAYYFLVIGVVIRFFELALPENSINRLASTYGYVTESTKKHGYVVKNYLTNIIGNISPKLKIKLSFKNRINISQYFDDNSYVSRLQQKVRTSLKDNADRYMDEISYTARNVAVFLSVFFFISLVYGFMIDWAFIKRYISNLVLIILGVVTLHIFTRRKTSGE